MKRILIIEDQIDDQEMLKGKYDEDNVQIDIAETGIETFYYLSQYTYNTVIVSNDMCDLDGLWIVQYIINEQQYDELILTSKFNHENLEKVARKMKFMYLRKPLEK